MKLLQWKFRRVRKMSLVLLILLQSDSKRAIGLREMNAMMWASRNSLVLKNFCSDLHHPHVVHIKKFIPGSHNTYNPTLILLSENEAVVMEFVEGGSLEDFLHKQSKFIGNLSTGRTSSNVEQDGNCSLSLRFRYVKPWFIFTWNVEFFTVTFSFLCFSPVSQEIWDARIFSSQRTTTSK